MPEHVHLLVTEPERCTPAIALQMLKQNVAHKIVHPAGTPFSQPRYYDFNVWTAEKRVEKLKYLHRNPVRRGLVEGPEDWPWSRYHHYAGGIDGVVEIELPTAACRRGQPLMPFDAAPTLSAKNADEGGVSRDFDNVPTRRH